MNAAVWVCSLFCLVAVSLHSPYMDLSSSEHRAGLTATDGEEMLSMLKTVNRLPASDSYAVCTDPVQAGGGCSMCSWHFQLLQTEVFKVVL